jgi:hypothetical protein
MGRFTQRQLPSRSGASLDPRQGGVIRLLSHLSREFLASRTRLRRLGSLRRLSCSSSGLPHAVVFQAQVFNAAEEQNIECPIWAMPLARSKGLARTKSAARCIGNRRQNRQVLPLVPNYPRYKETFGSDDDPLTSTWVRTFLTTGLLLRDFRYPSGRFGIL